MLLRGVGIGVNTVSNLEAGRNVSFENLVRVAMVLGRLKELEELFKPHLNSVHDMLRYESNTARRTYQKGNESMLKKLDVYYNGWGEYWLWGTLVSSTAITGRPLIAFEYSAEQFSKGLELSSYLLPLKGNPFSTTFPAHQMGLPGPIYDALPDGWGMLLMDRLFKKNGLNPARVGPLERPHVY